MNARTALIITCVAVAGAIPVSTMIGPSSSQLTGTTPLDRPLGEAIPRELDAWSTLNEDELGERALEITKVDDYVSRLYGNDAGDQVLLYVAYHGNKARGMQTYYHNASICYPAAGWKLQDETYGELTLHTAAKQVPTCRYLFERDGQRMTVLTFFKVDDELLDQSPRNKPFWRLADELTPRLDGSPGSFVQVQIVVTLVDRDERRAVDVSRRFLQDFGASIFQAVP